MLSNFLDFFLGEPDPSALFKHLPTSERRSKNARAASLQATKNAAFEMRYKSADRQNDIWQVRDVPRFFTAKLILFLADSKIAGFSDHDINRKLHAECIDVLSDWFKPESKSWTEFVSECAKFPFIKAIVPELFDGGLAAHLGRIQKQRKEAEEKAKTEDAAIIPQIRDLRKIIGEADSLAKKYAREGDVGRCYSQICRIESAQGQIRQLKRKLHSPIPDEAVDDLRTG
jgi:hypothetical protein